MTPAVLEQLRSVAAPADSAANAGGRLTLDELMSGVWEGLSARVPVACPVCSGELQPGSAPVACGDCGSSIS